jgi:hypothetical protein
MCGTVHMSLSWLSMQQLFRSGCSLNIAVGYMAARFKSSWGIYNNNCILRLAHFRIKFSTDCKCAAYSTVMPNSRQ